ncbi:MAG: oxidoreductase [Candidatus Neomarinimicrobiota bacterium]|jgi:3-oxoacyl-[acyl-carrier protein] reductase|nr:MAG: oxidoreductase [Candidatus Neomarinimicrobiota bacterium]HIN20135.1 glucose 1-dehydrogenase [Candidatus Neomarinimicrobiota bacterium]
MKLKNKVAVVTGGARDIGRAVCIKLASEGAKVVVNYFNSESNRDDTLNEIENMGGVATAVHADVSKQADIDKLVEKTKEAYGSSIDILVNNAGGLIERKTIEEIDENFYNMVMNINFKSVVFVTQAFKSMMKTGGSIINLSSQASRDGGGPGASIYAASKGAVTTFTRSMAKEFGPIGIRVNAITPGMITSKFHDDFTNDQVRKAVAQNTPLKREGKAEEVADLVAFLAGNGSSFISGNNVDINGGLAFS